MSEKINGLSFDVDCGNFSLHVLKCSLDITDNTKAVKRNGRPDGFVRGDVEASGTLTVDKGGLSTIIAAARVAGSFQALPVFDICFYAKVGLEECKVEAFGCKVKLSKVLDVDTSSSDETQFELPYEVTSSDFVHIDGVSYTPKD